MDKKDLTYAERLIEVEKVAKKLVETSDNLYKLIDINNKVLAKHAMLIDGLIKKFEEMINNFSVVIKSTNNTNNIFLQQMEKKKETTKDITNIIKNLMHLCEKTGVKFEWNENY